MSIEGWKYYNHAMIPTCAPHEEPDIQPILNGNVWKIPQRPLMARWTTDFNCQEETKWWYTICFAPFEPTKLSNSNQKHIRQALRKCYVKKIVVSEKMEDMYRVYNAAFEKYESADNEVSYENYCKGCLSSEKIGCDYWGGFDASTGLLIGYMVVRPEAEYAELQTTKLMPAYLNLRVSDALYYTVLSYYLNCLGKRYITSGSRNINHKTNSEEYKIKTFGYKRVYCRLHIMYHPLMKVVVNLLYPIRHVLHGMDKNTRIHQVNAVLKMEEIRRGDCKI